MEPEEGGEDRENRERRRGFVAVGGVGMGVGGLVVELQCMCVCLRVIGEGVKKRAIYGL